MGAWQKNRGRIWPVHSDSFCHPCSWNSLKGFLAFLAFLCCSPPHASPGQDQAIISTVEGEKEATTWKWEAESWGTYVVKWFTPAEPAPGLNQGRVYIVPSQTVLKGLWRPGHPAGRSIPFALPLPAAWACLGLELPMGPICHHGWASGPYGRPLRVCLPATLLVILTHRQTGQCTASTAQGAAGFHWNY